MRPSSSIISPLPIVLPKTKVSELIDPNLATWKTENVKQMFLPHEASMILGIPLSLRKPLDQVVWAHTPSGEFSTSSAYKFLVALAIVKNAGSSSRASQKSGRGYGSCVFLIGLNISFGGLVIMPCQQIVISSEDKLLPLTLESYAMVLLRMSCM